MITKSGASGFTDAGYSGMAATAYGYDENGNMITDPARGTLQAGSEYQISPVPSHGKFFF